MSKKNLDELLLEQEKEIAQKATKIGKRKKRFKISLIVFSVLTLLAVTIVFVNDKQIRNENYNEIISGKTNPQEAASLIGSNDELIMHPDLYDIYENISLGNKSLNSMNKGYYAENQFAYTSTTENGEYIIHFAENEATFSTEEVSHINLGKDFIVFRGNDKKVYYCKIDGTEKNLLIDDKVGTVLLVENELYYVSLSKNYNLYKYNITEKNCVLVEDSAISNFTVAGNWILYQDFSNKLVAIKKDSGVTQWSHSNINKFYFNGDVIVQNNKKVIKFNLNNHFPEELANNVDLLLGADEKCIYYTADRKVYSQNIKTGEKAELFAETGVYDELYVVNNEVKIRVGE